MTDNNPTSFNLRQFFNQLKKDYLWWVVPTVVLTVLSIGYALVRTPTWEATQAMLVRDQAGGKLSPQGRFDSSEAMKSAQETILEIARSQNVVQAALKQAGPANNRAASGNWPTNSDVADLQDAISVRAPNGSEFGQTEVIHLAVQATTRERSIQLTAAVFQQLDSRLRELRDVKARSIADELTKAEKLATQDLEASTKKLEAIETEVGTDLGELRSLSNSAAGDSNLRSALNQINVELRAVEANHEAIMQQQDHLNAARRNPDHLVAMPSRLLESQPALSRLKDGLIDAQLNTSTLMGRMSKDHPHVKAAIVAEAEVRANLHKELDVALRGVQAEMKINTARIETLWSQEADIKGRLDRLAKLRARYSNLVDEVAQRTESFKKAQQDLSDARGNLAAAQSASLVTPLDGLVAGNHPLGPGKSMIVLCGLFGGLLAGIGIVFLKEPLGQLSRRRWTDFFPARRNSDQVKNNRRDANREGGRRDKDPRPAPLVETRQPATDTSASRERRNDSDRRSGERRAGSNTSDPHPA